LEIKNKIKDPQEAIYLASFLFGNFSSLVFHGNEDASI